MKSRLIAIGDIHGCVMTFRNLVLEGIKLNKEDEMVCIGDYIDRGPDAKGVIDFILDLRQQGYTIHTLRGNHEQLMLESESGEGPREHWLINGGDVTLKSFSINSYDGMDSRYKEFFQQTLFYFEKDTFIFVHAGLDLSSGDLFEDKDAMLWMRGFSATSEMLGGRTVIHGHTPQPLQEILKSGNKSVLNIDGGCVYRDRTGLGNLVAVDLTNREWIHVKNSEGPY